MMEKQLKCVLLLSLREISLRRVAALLWNGSDILASISEISTYEYYDNLKMIEKRRKTLVDKIKYKMLKLDIPESLANRIIEVVGLMSLEVRAWKFSQQALFWPSDDAIGLPDSAKLCWTTAGIINYRKTAEELFRCDKLNVEQGYIIACHYCLEDRISIYLEELPEEAKDTYGTDEFPLPYLTYCWPYILEGKHSDLEYLAYRRNLTSFNQFAFENSAEKGYKTAAEYFFQKLTLEEREASLMRTALAVIANCNICRIKELSDLLFYLLSLMTAEQQMEIIKACPIDVFSCFLRLQLQGLFRENAGLLWALFPPSSYIDLLERIYLDYPIVYLPKMIQELFIESPQDFKACFVDETSSEFPKTPAFDFLRAFFHCKDSESIRVILRNVDSADRVKIVRRNFRLFYDYMLKDEWHLVELCLREATLSKEEKGRLKDDFAAYLENVGRGSSKSPVFKRFFAFLDETDASYDKRKKGQNRKA